MTLSKKEKKRVAELNEQIYELEHSGVPGTFQPKLIPLYQEMQELYRKQETTEGSVKWL